jgi:ATP-dependent Clp protease adapter protein ClpS
MSDDALDALSPIDLSPADTQEQAQAGVRATTDGASAILIFNDDVTPYSYVMYMLGDLFMLSEELADHVAWTAHTKGKAVVVVRPRVEAEKLVKVARGRARMDGYPLAFALEQA